MVLPLLMDMETDGYSKTNEKESNIRDYIYLEDDGKILKYSVGFGWMDILKLLERYINNHNITDLYIVSEEQANKNYLPLNVIPYVGRFKLDGSFKKTNNYLAPKTSRMLLWLCKKNKDQEVLSEDLNSLFILAKEAYTNHDKEKLSFMKDIVNNMKYSFIDGNLDVKQIEELIKYEKNEKKLAELKWILETSRLNKKYLRSFGLEDKFIEISTLHKQNQKVKS